MGLGLGVGVGLGLGLGSGLGLGLGLGFAQVGAAWRSCSAPSWSAALMRSTARVSSACGSRRSKARALLTWLGSGSGLGPGLGLGLGLGFRV